MRIFKQIKRKVGNAIIPVVGTILGLTILAGSVVSVALNSSKIVYKQNNLSNQNDARQILYIAARYFCIEINNGKTDSQIRAELQEIFGPGLKITKDTTDPEKYYIWYPNRFVDSNQKEFDPNRDNSQVAEWLKATIVKKEGSDDDGDYGDHGINNTLFSQEAKLDEKFAVGNMMTVYLTDEHLLPGRKYSINEVSLVESDIDTFDEAFTYMNNTGVLEIDDIAIALYKYGLVSNSGVNYINAKEDGSFEIVYKTGNLGGNYYWSNNGTSTETWLYRQEYDIDLLYEMICYQNSSNSSISKSNLKYAYEETTDSHRIYSDKASDNFELTYSSSQRFADAIADYIFWKNLPRLCMYLTDFQSVIKADAENKWRYDHSSWYNQGYRLSWRDLSNLHWYEWSDAELTLYPSWSNYYTEYHYTDNDIVNFFQNNSTLKTKYTTSNKLDRTKLYNALVTQISSNMFSGNSEQIQNAYETIVKNLTYTYRSESRSNDYILSVTEGFWIFGTTYYYYWDQNKWNNNVINIQGQKDHILHNAVEDFLLGRLTEKYITGTATKDPVALQGAQVQEIDAKSLEDFQWNIENGNMKLYYRVKAKVKRANGQIDTVAPMSDETGDTFWFKSDGVYMGNERVITYADAKSGRETFIKTFIETFAQMAGISLGDIYTEEEVTYLTREQLKTNLVSAIRYQYLPTYAFTNNSETKGILNSIIGTGSTSKYGMKQQNIANKLLTFYLENGEAELKAAIGDLDYDINIKKIEYKDDLADSLSNFIDMQIQFEIVVYKSKNQTQKFDRTVSFVIQFQTYSGQNTALYNETTDTYTDVLNGNYVSDYDSDGNLKNVFSAVGIKNDKGEALGVSDIVANKTRAILSNIPYTERINSNQVPYGDHKITIDGTDYTVVTDINVLKNVTQNVLYDGEVSGLSSNFKIKVADGKSLFINGDLSLKDNNQVELGRNSLLFVNGNMQVYYRVTSEMRKSGNTYYTRELRTTDYNTFVNNGVNIKADVDAKIMINGNFDYRGFKGRYATSSSGSFQVYNAQTGKNETVRVDTIYEQYVLNAGFKDRNNVVHGNCVQNADGTWTHNEEECRGLLEGIYIINGDMVFHAWDENNTTDNSNQILSMYRNMYSNPLINGTFYVDGVFDMKGLYTSGLYDQCRSNFVFAKSISEPNIALNTVLCQGSNTNYGAWDENDGYLFMICEDAIDFSKVNFACVNLFTPFQELVNAINANKQSATNFSEFIEKAAFTAMYPNSNVIDEWGLPSILRSGLAQLYDPGDIGAITPEDEIYGNPV